MTGITLELFFFWQYFSIQFGQIFPYWILGMTLGSIIAVFGKEKIHHLFATLREKKLGLLGIIPASLLGIASPLCMYGTIPIAASFAQKGMREDWIAAFMMASILLNPQIFLYSIALGLPALVIRFVSCFLGGIIAGICVKLLFAKKPFFTFTAFEKISSRDTDPNLVLRLLKNLGRNVKATGLYLVIGIVLAVLFQRYVPQQAFARLFGANRGVGLLIASTIGVPLYVCGGAAIPLILAWMHSGMSLGAVASFMIAGPAMKITNLGALKMVLGIKHFLLYLLFAVAFSIITGLAVNMTPF